MFDAHNAPDPKILRISAKEHYHLPDMLVQHKEAMVERLAEYPYEKNIFVMMRFGNPVAREDPLFQLMCDIVDAQQRGYNCVRADMPQWQITNEDVSNPYAVLQCCKYGIALFNKEITKDREAFVNVGIELAVMRMLNRQCVMLVHESIGELPFDLGGKIRREYDQTEEITRRLGDWLRSLD